MATKSQALNEIYNAAPADRISFDTFEIIHPAFKDANGNPTSVRIVQGFEDLQATLEPDAPMNPGQVVDFGGMTFQFTRTAYGSGVQTSMQLIVQNISRQMVEILEEARSSPAYATVIYREYILTDLSAPQLDPPIEMQVTDVSVDVFRATFTLDVSRLQNRGFPSRIYTLSAFPGLNR